MSKIIFVFHFHSESGGNFFGHFNGSGKRRLLVWTSLLYQVRPKLKFVKKVSMLLGRLHEKHPKILQAGCQFPKKPVKLI